MIPTGGSDSLGVWAYIAASEELKADLVAHAIERAAVALATGSAGTQTGLTAGVALFDVPASVTGYAVCDDAEWFNRRVMSDWQASVDRWAQLPDITIAPRTRDHSVGPGYGRADPSVYALITELTRLEGIVLDPVYTGKAFKGLVEDIAGGFYDDWDDIVFVHTGGVFGLFSLGALQGARGHPYRTSGLGAVINDDILIAASALALNLGLFGPTAWWSYHA